MNDGINLYRQMLATAQNFNALLQEQGEEFNMISRDTAAKLLSVIGIQGGDERIVLSPKIKEEIDYIQDRYHIHGGEAPDVELVEYIQHYTRIINEHINEHNEFPQWVYEFFQSRYKFKLYKP